LWQMCVCWKGINGGSEGSIKPSVRVIIVKREKGYTNPTRRGLVMGGRGLSTKRKNSPEVHIMSLDEQTPGLERDLGKETDNRDGREGSIIFGKSIPKGGT